VDWNSFEYRENLLGELKVDNLTTSIKLQDISTISFDIPENIFGEFNPRLDDVLDNYIVELWYGDLSNPTIQRFVIIKTPMEYNNGLKKYSYQGDSIEGTLEFQQMLNWGGIQVKDFYRTIKYEYVKSGTTVTTNRFTENPATGVSAPTYTISTSTQTVAEGQEAVKYITIPTTTASSNPPSPLDIFIYQYRRDAQDTLNTESSLIEFNQNTSGGTQYQNESGFKPGFYIPVLNSLGKVTSIHIALPKDYTSFYTTIDSVSSNKVLEFFLYDNPVSRHFAIGINTDEEIEASDMYLDLAQDSPVKFQIRADAVQNSNILITAFSNYNITRLVVGQTIIGIGIPSATKITALVKDRDKLTVTLSNNYTSTTGINKSFLVESLNAAEYGAYGFTAQIAYSRNGLKLEDCLLGTQETRNALNEIQNNKLNFDGILFETGYTIGVIHPEIASKYRSNIELNNITKYQAIKNLAESFEAITIFDNVNKTVSFYPDKNEQAFSNNGLIITKQNYLKDITNDIDASKVITKAYASGKNNLGISLITPNGGNYWEDYSYYLDSYYVAYPSDSNLTNEQKLAAMTSSGVILGSGDTVTGLTFTTFPTGTLARWINATEALKISKWQFTRDYFHDIMLGNFTSTITAHNTRYFDLYNLRSTAINEFVKEETKYFELKATEYRYKYIYDSYVKENDNLAENTRQKTFKYKFDSSTTIEDPGTKDFRLNTNAFTTATQIIIDDLDNSNIDRRSFLSSITTTKNPRIQLKTTAKSAVYQIDSVNSTNTGYIILNVTNIFNSGTAGVFTNTELVDLIFLTWEEVYSVKYTEAKNASAVGLNKLNEMHYNIYNTKFDGSIALSTETNLINIQTNSFATKIQEVQNFLSKDVWSIDNDELKPFVKETVMSDSALDNELDLLTATREFLIENGQPIVTIDISILDFLSSVQTSMDWNKVKIGEIINIYYPDFNIDTTAQLREIDIDFQSNKLNFTISTYRKYTRNLMTYVLKNLRKTYDSQTNNYDYQYDENKVGTERIKVIDKKVKKGKKQDGGGGGFDATETPFNFGSMSADGSTSTDISGEGIVSKIVEVDPVLETFIYKNEKSLQIADGTLTAKNLVRDESDVLVYKTEVEVSGDNGFVIRKINPNGDVLPQVYIDTNGNAVFAGKLVVGGQAPQTIEDFLDNIESEIDAGTTVYRAASQEDLDDALETANTNDILLITGSFPELTAPYTYTKDDIYKFNGSTFVIDLELKNKTTGTVGGWTIDSSNIKSNNGNVVLNSDSAGTGAYPHISIAQSTQGYNQQGIFLGIAPISSVDKPVLSLVGQNGQDYLRWNGSTLELSSDGTFRGTASGNITGTVTGTINGSGTLTGTINNSGNGTITGSMVIGDPASSKITLMSSTTAAGTKIYSDTGVFETSGFYMDASGRFSLGNKLSWDGTLLSIDGDIGGDIGEINVGDRIIINQDGIEGLDISDNRTFFLDSINGDVFINGTLSVGQNISGFDQQGVFVGKELGTSKFSLVSGSTFMTFNPDSPDYKLIISGEAKIGPLTIGAIGDTFINFTSNTTPINYIKKLTTTTDGSQIIGPITPTNLIVGMSVLGTGIQSGSTLTSLSPVTMSLAATLSSTRLITYAIRDAEYNFNSSDIFSITITSSGTHDQVSTRVIENAQVYVEIYKDTTLLTTTDLVTIPANSFNPPFYSYSTILDLNGSFNANKIKVYSLGTTTTANGTWNITPSVSATSANLNMGNFSVDEDGYVKSVGILNKNPSSGYSFENEGVALFGNSTGTKLAVEGAGTGAGALSIVPSSITSGNPSVTIPSVNGQTIIHTGTENVSSVTSTDLYIVSRISAGSDIKLAANDNIRLQPGDGVRLYNTTVPLVGSQNFTRLLRPTQTTANTIQMPLINGTFELKRIQLTAASPSQNNYTGYRDAIDDWMFVELFRGTAKVYEVNIYVPSVSTVDNTTLYPYVWREPTSGLFGDTMTIQRSGTSIQIKTNAGGTTTFKFWRYGNPASGTAL
jgi:hypothetical protein